MIWQPDRLHRHTFPNKARNLIIPSWTWTSCEGAIILYHIGLRKLINAYHTDGRALRKMKGLGKLVLISVCEGRIILCKALLMFPGLVGFFSAQS